MKFIFSMIFILVLLFFQIGILPHLAIREVYPNIVLVSFISFVILRGFKKSIVWAIAAGLFLDFYSLNNIVGIFVVCFLLSSYLAFFLSQNIFKKSNPSSVIPIFFLTTIFYNLSALVLHKIFSLEFDFGILTFLVNVLYNTIIAIPVFYLIKKYYARKPDKI
ncbi:MAG: rod shape-determining protein MreD [bacterium]|nr:rod shape-determining protein MreD [bacterium]